MNLKSLISIFGSNNFSRSKVKTSLENVFEKLAKETIQHDQIDCQLSGTTALSIFLFQKHAFIASVGDSRAIMGIESQGSWIYQQLSKDHSLSDKFEFKRIKKCKGRIEQSRNQFGDYVGPQRVWHENYGYPGLAMTRSLGDALAKDLGVIDTPGTPSSLIKDITCVELNPSCKFFVLATDGIWDVLTNDNVIEICVKCIETKGPDFCAREICSEASDRWKRVLVYTIK